MLTRLDKTWEGGGDMLTPLHSVCVYGWGVEACGGVVAGCGGGEVVIE